jgi:hypothetical protein
MKPSTKRKSGKSAPVTAPDRSQRCHTCGRSIAGFESVHYGSMEGGYRDLCNRCFNEEVAETGGIDFSHVQFEALEVSDAAGTPHRFHFEIRLLGDKVSLQAFELVKGDPGGYEFQVLGDAEADLFELMGQMVPRIRRLLARQHLKTDTHMPGLHIADFMVRGRITWDDNEDGRLPMLVIDGKEISWDQFGRMVMGFEGWQFRLEIKDRSEEI